MNDLLKLEKLREDYNWHLELLKREQDGSYWEGVKAKLSLAAETAQQLATGSCEAMEGFAKDGSTVQRLGEVCNTARKITEELGNMIQCNAGNASNCIDVVINRLEDDFRIGTPGGGPFGGLDKNDIELLKKLLDGKGGEEIVENICKGIKAGNKNDKWDSVCAVLGSGAKIAKNIKEFSNWADEEKRINNILSRSIEKAGIQINRINKEIKYLNNILFVKNWEELTSPKETNPPGCEPEDPGMGGEMATCLRQAKEPLVRVKDSGKNSPCEGIVMGEFGASSAPCSEPTQKDLEKWEEDFKIEEFAKQLEEQENLDQGPEFDGKGADWSSPFDQAMEDRTDWSSPFENAKKNFPSSSTEHPLTLQKNEEENPKAVCPSGNVGDSCIKSDGMVLAAAGCGSDYQPADWNCHCNTTCDASQIRENEDTEQPQVKEPSVSTGKKTASLATKKMKNPVCRYVGEQIKKLASTAMNDARYAQGCVNSKNPDQCLDQIQRKSNTMLRNMENSWNQGNRAGCPGFEGSYSANMQKAISEINRRFPER